MQTTLFFGVFVGTVLGLLGLAGVLHLLPRLGAAGRVASAWAARAPGLDLVVGYFIVLPLIVGPAVAGWLGLVAAVAGQAAGLMAWVAMHELAHPDARRGPRIVKVLNRIVGRWRNHAALWVTVPVAPVFYAARLAQLTLYPLLTVLVGLPSYRSAEWVNVSRQKFAGLVGHDRIWCLYCDWMTGVWSLGSEMLRNVESFWCPIRFSSEAKCQNCRLDFPDVYGLTRRNGNGEVVTSASWVRADGDMAEVAALLEQQYAGRTARPWYGHPARLTVEGEPLANPAHEAAGAAAAK